MLLMSFFPHLVAGSIVPTPAICCRNSPKAPKLSREMAAHGLLLIAWGLFKKTVIASELATRAGGSGVLRPHRLPTGDLIGAAYGYTVQIYFDFSAYSDIAIGVAALLGYRFPRN